jgi:hypothetical protein
MVGSDMSETTHWILFNRNMLGIKIKSAFLILYANEFLAFILVVLFVLQYYKMFNRSFELLNIIL